MTLELFITPESEMASGARMSIDMPQQPRHPLYVKADTPLEKL